MPNQPLASTKHRVSVHFPNVGASALRHALRENLPRPDPEINDVHPAMNLKLSSATALGIDFRGAGCAPDIRVVEGHCPPVRFRFGRNARFRAVSPNPVDRLVSSHRHHLGGHQIQPGEADLLTGAATLQPSNHCRRYLSGLPIEPYDFMGVTDGSEPSEVRLGEFPGQSSPSPCRGHRINPGKRAATLSCYVLAPRRAKITAPNEEGMPICDQASPSYSCGRTRTTMCYPG